MLSITDLVREVVQCLVDKPEQIQIDEITGDRTVVINITVPKDEVGKIIGRQGRIITAIRTIAENIAAKLGKRVSIHIID